MTSARGIQLLSREEACAACYHRYEPSASTQCRHVLLCRGVLQVRTGPFEEKRPTPASFLMHANAVHAGSARTGREHAAVTNSVYTCTLNSFHFGARHHEQPLTDHADL